MRPNTTQNIDVSAGGNVAIETLIRAAAGSVEVASDPTTRAPTNGRVLEDADDGSVYVGDGDKWLDVSAEVGLEGSYPVSGEYTGDGSTTGREIPLGYQPQYVTVHRSGATDVEMIHIPTGEAQADVVIGGSLTTSVEVSTSCYISAGGFTVGDGDNTGNANGETYRWDAW